MHDCTLLRQQNPQLVGHAERHDSVALRIVSNDHYER